MSRVNVVEGCAAAAGVSDADRIRGCLLGGAIGDALGAGIEFDSIDTIRREHGPAGVTAFVPAYGRAVAITDDTQMTLFTLEGLIRASVRSRTRGLCHMPSVVRHAYMRWMHTQGYAWPPPGPLRVDSPPDGWLIGVTGLHAQRAPGTTCLSGLSQQRLGTPDAPLNDSAGCGGVMRAAPAGFVTATTRERFEYGCQVAALSHGNPRGYLPAGVLAAVIGNLIEGDDLTTALDRAEAVLREWTTHQATLVALTAGRLLGESGNVTPERIESLGGGWVGDEALAIAVACALAATSFEDGVLLAVNHSGDSDSTGSISGNILGAAGGIGTLPADWLATVELAGVIDELARDAALELRGEPPTDALGQVPQTWLDRYPGW